MGYRRNRDRHSTEYWVAKYKSRMLELGVPSCVLSDAYSFAHDFLLHGYDVPPDLSSKDYQALLQFFFQHFDEEMFSFGLTCELARKWGPNAELCCSGGLEEAHGQWWFHSKFGTTPAYVISASENIQNVCLYFPEQAWAGLEFWKISSGGEWLGQGTVERVGYVGGSRF